MIDTDKYEGHTPGPWMVEPGFDKSPDYTDIREKDGPTIIASIVLNSNWDLELQNEMSANARLLTDAPLLLEAYKRLRERLEITSSHMNFNYPSGDSDKWSWQVELHEARVCDGVGSCAVCECTEYMVTHFKSGESDGPFATYEEAKAHYDSHDEEWREAHYIEEVRE